MHTSTLNPHNRHCVLPPIPKHFFPHCLTQACAYKLQDAILSSRGVVRLMDMLAEREVIRNEALVLLVTLTHANEEVQKIAAFEGAFDRCVFVCVFMCN